MKQILYFLIGVIISIVLLLPFAQAATECDNGPAGFDPSSVIYGSPDSSEFLGFYINGNPYIEYWVIAGSEGYGFSQSGIGVSGSYIDGYGQQWVVAGAGYRDSNYNTKVFYYFYTGGSQCGPVPDTDGDGLPDDQDMYPNDPEPYSVRLSTYQTTDGTPDSEHIRECYETDRHDVFCVGASYDPDKPTNALFSEPWRDPIDVFGGAPSSTINTGDSEGGTISDRPYSADAPDGDAPTNTDPNLKPGTQSTGTETDNEALIGIKDNTGIIAGNTKRQGEYMKDLNAAIQSMDRRSAMNQGIEDMKDNANNAEAQAAKTEFNNSSVSDHYNDSNFNGTLTEGTDYEPATDLDQESWFTSFFTNNPLKAAYDASGFDMTNSTCQMTLTIDGLGTHTLSLCEFDQEFQTAGNLLVGLTSLTALIIIAWR